MSTVSNPIYLDIFDISPLPYMKDGILQYAQPSISKEQAQTLCEHPDFKDAHPKVQFALKQLANGREL